MDMIGHQAIRYYLDLMLMAVFLEIGFSVFISEKYVFPAVSSG